MTPSSTQRQREVAHWLLARTSQVPAAETATNPNRRYRKLSALVYTTTAAAGMCKKRIAAIVASAIKATTRPTPDAAICEVRPVMRASPSSDIPVSLSRYDGGHQVL